MLLIQKIKDKEERLWYAQKAIEYALKDISKPIGISEYRLNDAIPDNLKSSLPTIADLERELKDLKLKKKK